MKDKLAQPGVVADGPVCHGLCGAQPAPSRPAAKRYVGCKNMILRISDDLGQKIKDRPSKVLPLDNNPYADWTCRLFTESRTQYIMITNTVSLYTMVMYGKGISNDLVFTDRVTSYIAEFLRDDGYELIFERLIGPSMVRVSFSKALNRRVTGSMNDLEYHAQYLLRRGEVSPWGVSYELNGIPFSYLNMNRPKDAFKSMKLNEGASNQAL